MILDAYTCFSSAQAVTADARSTNQIDLQSPAIVTTFNGKTINRNIGGTPGLKIFATVTTTFLTIVSMNLVLRTDADTAFGSPVILWTSRLFLLAELNAGFQFDLPDVPTITERYLELYYDVNTSATAGNISAYLVIDKQQNPIG
jgi:hypothetical protein